MVQTACATHAEAPAVASCRICFAPLCEVCRVVERMQPYCARCLRKERRAPLVGRALTIAGLAVVGAGGYWIVRGYQNTPDHGVRTAQVNRLEDALAQEPCDRPKVRLLLDQLLAAGDNRGVLARAAAFWAKCGDEPEMREATYAAHQRLGELDQANADLTALIATSPSSPYYRAWRGAVLEEQGNLDGAAADLQQALILYPEATDIPQNLATVYEKQGKLCDATVPLEGLLFRYGDKPFAANIKARIAALEERGACTSSATGARTTLRATRSGMFVARARLSNAETTTVLVDTGATYVAITRKVADRLHLDLGDAPRRELRTANGKREGAFVILPSVAVGGLSTERVPAVVIDDLGAEIDGLLGQSFLSRFEMKQAGGVLELSVRAPSSSPSAAALPGKASAALAEIADGG